MSNKEGTSCSTNYRCPSEIIQGSINKNHFR